MVVAWLEKNFLEAEKETINRTKKKISNNLGEIILTYRKIYLGSENTGDFAPPLSKYDFYLESGIICGDMTEGTGKMNIIDLFTRSISRSLLSSIYSLFSDYLIPVERKITNLSYQIPLEKIVDNKKGEIGIARYELFPLGRDLDCNKHPPYLKKFALLIGDAEIKKFLADELKQGSSLLFREDTLNDFLYLMKNPKEAAKRIEQKDFDMRENLGQELVLSISDLIRAGNKLQGIEEKVLKLNYRIERRGQDGDKNIIINDPITYETYDYLNHEILSSLGKVNSLLKKANEIDLKKHSEINGNIIGFPSKIKPGDFLIYANEVISPISERISKLENHIRKIRKNI